MPIQRKYDFQSGTKISSQQVNDELNQLVAASNNNESANNQTNLDVDGLDTRVLELEKSNPFFYSVSGEVSNANPAELQQLPMSGATVKRNTGFTIGTNEMIATEDGNYFIDIQANWSGANQDIEFHNIIRRVKADNTYADTVFIHKGSVGGNSGGFQTRGSVITNLNIGDKIQLFNRHYESGPRKIIDSWAKCFKVSKL